MGGLKNEKLQIFYGDQNELLRFEFAKILTNYQCKFEVVAIMFWKKLMKYKMIPLKYGEKNLFNAELQNFGVQKRYTSSKTSQIRHLRN